MPAFKKAIKHEAKLRLALAGPAGSGKTYTALSLASLLAGDKPVAVIDTERGSASKYADLFSFDVLELESYHPDRYVEAIQEAVSAGYGVVVIDSLSHAWNGHDGLLELVEQLGKRKYNGNSFKAWGDVKPVENRLVEALTASSVHVIATMRSKTEYVVEQNDRGKATPRKVGTAPIQRDGFEYEFDVFGEMTQDNELIIHKTRCPALTNALIAKPGKPLADTLRIWLSGAPTPTPVKAERPLPELTPISQVERPAAPAPTPAPAPKPQNAALTVQTLFARSKALGVTPQEWAAIKRECGTDLAALSAKLDDIEVADIAGEPDMAPEDAERAYTFTVDGDETPVAHDLAGLAFPSTRP